jgi:hypothetical protein
MGIQKTSIVSQFLGIRFIMILLVFGVVFFFQPSQVFAQDLPSAIPVAFRPNTIHGGLGSVGIVASATFNYERFATQHFDKFIVATFAKVGFGTYGS